MLIKSELDKRVAEAIGVPVRHVATVTDGFIQELVNAVVDEGGFYLVGLGRLRIRFEKGSTNVRKDSTTEPMRIKLYFSKSRVLKKLIERKFGIYKEPMAKQQDEGMTKYAVDEGHDPEKLEKAAAQGCPICAAPCTKHGSVLACPTHGTEPFE